MSDNIPNIGETIDLYYEMEIKYKHGKRPKMMEGCEVLIRPKETRFDGEVGFKETLICPSRFSKEAEIISKNTDGGGGVLSINSENVEYTKMEPVSYETEGKYGIIEFTDQVKHTFNRRIFDGKVLDGAKKLFSKDKNTGTGHAEDHVRTNYEKEYIKCYYKMREKEGGGEIENEKLIT